MTISEFYTTVRVLSRANVLDFPNTEIAIMAQIEANKLYELSVQAWNQEQTKDQTPTVLSFNALISNFIPTDDNLWIERVEYSRDGTFYYPLKRTNKTEYEGFGCVCTTGSLTDDLVADGCADYFIQTSQGIHVFPIGGTTTGSVRIYIKDTPVIDWTDMSYTILIPNVAVDLITVATALLYKDIENTNGFNKLKIKYDDLMKVYQTRLRKGGHTFRMKVSKQEDNLE